jgi:AraC-like DNA-binding protein
MEENMQEVYWTYDHILISKGYNDPKPHKHFAKHLIFSNNDEFESAVGGLVLRCKGICIDSNIIHTVKHDAEGLLVFLFNETSNLAGELSEKYLKGAPYIILKDELAYEVGRQWSENCTDAGKLDETVLSLCNLLRGSPAKYDNRIYQLLEHVYKLEGIDKDTMESLCSMVCLSHSRLSHLFSEQVGISLGSYLVFGKMLKAYTYIAAGDSITDACIRAGFNGSSHFANVCRNMFGIAFTDFSKTAILMK